MLCAWMSLPSSQGGVEPDFHGTGSRTHPVTPRLAHMVLGGVASLYRYTETRNRNTMPIAAQPWFASIIRPSRYLGNEINSIRKDPSAVEVSVALAFPDVYEIGMSHLGLKILYHLLNAHPWLAAERVFTPWVDMEEAMRRNSYPLTSLESGRPLSSFDVVGFSLQHELCYTNILTMLDLSGIPFEAERRTGAHPLIIAGGPACFNPEPVADLFDAVVIGDGERPSLELSRVVRDAKRSGPPDRARLLSRLSRIEGVYVPSLFRIRYTDGGTVGEIAPRDPDYTRVDKAILPDLDEYPTPDRQVVPFMELVHDRVVVEIARGCTRGCRFCQAGMIYRPVRERSPRAVLDQAEGALKHTGHDEMSLLSLSSGDYCAIAPLLTALMDRHSADRVAVSLPSLRIDSLEQSWMEQIKRVRKTGFTLAVEAGNERMRSVINKGLTDEDILTTARTVYEAGWNLIKLYFMVGLPSETEDDVRDIVRLATRVLGTAGKKRRRAQLNVSVSTFVPKANTPFMWEPQISIEESRERLRIIQDGLRGTAIRVKWNQPELSWLEGIFARGDRRLTGVLLEAWKTGARFDGWGEHFRKDRWEDALNRAGLDPAFYLHRQRPLDEVLPWDHLRCGVTRAFFIRELARARAEQPTADCRQRCLECGVCDHTRIDPVLFKDPQLVPETPTELREKGTEEAHTYRLTFTKLHEARYLGHLELMRTFLRAFRRVGLSLSYSRGFHPKPRVSFTCALPLGTESLQETMSFESTVYYDPRELTVRINGQLPGGISVTLVEELDSRRKNEHLKESRFHITVPDIPLRESAIEAFFASNYFPVVKVNKKGQHSIDMRPLVGSLSLVSAHEAELTVVHTTGPELKPAEIVRHVFGLDEALVARMRILKSRQILA